ncbi:MAG: NAD(P)H-dependent oxidoreductase [Candidatus Synoicihabitans palmerolidicus]|nr:NAD(P)H-dependent oxidoreductase [Candidatus Synoicihabitans palmerolidicus]
MSILVVSSSLNSDSNSRLLAQAAMNALTADGLTPKLLDLNELPLPFCDGSSAYGHPNTQQVSKLASEASGFIFASPIYNYDVNAALKNFIELVGGNLEDKTVAFLNAAGGTSSYMSIMALANSLMLDFRSVVVPRFVYAVPADFADGAIANPKITERVATCARALASLTAQRTAA